MVHFLYLLLDVSWNAFTSHSTSNRARWRFFFTVNALYKLLTYFPLYLLNEVTGNRNGDENELTHAIKVNQKKLIRMNWEVDSKDEAMHIERMNKWFSKKTGPAIHNGS